MTGSLIIDGLMLFFSLALAAAVAVPAWLFLPKWMESVQTRRIAFHRAAIDAITAELARPQADPGHVDRLLAQRQANITALRSLVPGAVVAPLPQGVAGLRLAA
ncbi:hypothetical protein [Polymorphobacter fuscus]|uniref:Uncharacterized protein n=1 Tax=Sandarakinorhabdus fusca TaxID=1439888 RepID=A0A7C9KNS1_9SPHN|nr:hypothetical protein [Polymorphobacter fuscus]KAB7643638.1 hypothetical protein F9290_15850 [Polymorphobacter fuscus]MQT18723.1 hypothetical protein [Polymorphobacter fuscus]NJC09613.1 hypothetical protein [Polymorphobacter fuscus]